MKLPIYKSNDELPLAMNAKDVAGYMNISLTCAYTIMHSKKFPVIQIGRRLIVTRDNFLRWVNSSDGQII